MTELQKPNDKKNAGFYTAWVGVPTLIAGGGVTAIVSAVKSGNVGAGVAGGAALLATAFVLWRRFAR